MMEQEKTLFEALGIFIKKMRSVFQTLCLREFGVNWETSYSETFRHDSNRNLWNTQINNGERPENLIDFGNLEMFAERHRESPFFRQKFMNDNINYRIPTYFKDIADVRNSLMHFQAIDNNKTQRAYINMESIANALNMDELEECLKNLRKNTIKEETTTNIQKEDLNKRIDNSSKRLRIELNPSDVDEFKRLLLINRRAFITTHYNNQEQIRKEWIANNMTENSNIIGNLRSRTEFRAGNWQKNNISHVYVSIEED